MYRAMHHDGPIAGIASHGALIATAGYDNRIILWDARSRVGIACANHDHLVNQCAFSSDGRWLVSASSDYSARVWEVPTLRLKAVLPGHGDDVDMAVFSPNDRRIATCALDRCVRIFDLDGRCLCEMRGHTGNVLSLAWSPDGRHVVSSSVDGTIRRWDTERHIEIGATDLGIRADSVEIAPDGRIYAGDDRGRIAIIEQGDARFVHAHHAGIKKIALDARRGVLVSLSYDRAIAVWRVGGHQGLEEIARSALPETIWARTAAVLDDGRIATGTFGSTYAVFDPQSSVWNLDGVAASGAINSILSVQDRIYSVGDAGLVCIDGVPAAKMGSLCNFLVAVDDRVFTGGHLGRLFDANTGAVLYEHRSPLNCGIAFIKHGKSHLAIGTYTGDMLIFALGADGQLQLITEIGVYEHAVKGLSSSDGLIFSVCASTDIAWHRIEDWTPAKRVSKAHERIANGCCAIGDRHFASVGRDRTLRLWMGAESEVYHSPHANSVKCIGVNADRTAVLTGSYGGTLALFDLIHKRWSPLRRPTAAGISSIAWDGSRRRFLAASYDGSVYPVQP
jgi:toxoflavin biosynthesis protein ToxC